MRAGRMRVCAAGVLLVLAAATPAAFAVVRWNPWALAAVHDRDDPLGFLLLFCCLTAAGVWIALSHRYGITGLACVLVASGAVVAAGLVVLKLHSLGDGSPRVVARLTDGPHEARLVERDDFLGTRWDVVLSRRSGGRYREALAGCVYAPDGGEVRLASLNRGRAVLTGLDGAEIDICSTPRR